MTTPRARILLVDDRPENLLALEAILQPLGQEIVRAASGEDALRAVLRDDFAVILLDVQMPGLNGFQATRAITREEKTKHIPVIICTTKDQETDKIWGLRQGAKDYITKPLSESDLLEKIKALS